MAYDDPSSWGFWTWWLHALGGYYFVAFFVYFFRFRRVQQEMAQGVPGARDKRNRMVRGFPGSGFAKMLGVKRD